MKIYQVEKSYYDGDHDHGKYESPTFSTRKAAEKFLSKVWGKEAFEKNEENIWNSYFDGGEYGEFRDDDAPYIIEIEIKDECPEEVKESDHYLNITYT